MVPGWGLGGLPEWPAACDSVAKSQLACRAANLEAVGAVPEMLTQILADLAPEKWTPRLES